MGQITGWARTLRVITTAAAMLMAMGLAASRAAALTWTAPSGTPVTLTGIPVDVVSGDFNGDGKQDIAISEEGTNAVRVLLGDGAGNFSDAPGSPVAALTNVTQLTTGDINNDGKPELAAAVGGAADGWATLAPDVSGVWQRHLGGGSGIGAGEVEDLAIADFDKDGARDYAFVNSETSDNITVFRGDGAGGTHTYNPPIAPDTPPYDGADLTADPAPNAVIATDVDGDGYPDIVTVGGASGSTGELQIWDDNQAIDDAAAPGTFHASDFTLGETAPVGDDPTAVVSADFNGDGTPDFAVLNSDSDSVTIVLDDGLGGYNAEPAIEPLPGASQLSSLAVGDFNGDGRPDLVVSGENGQGPELAVALGHGDGTFTHGGTVAQPHVPGGIATADLNGDGRPDVVAIGASYTAPSVLLNSSQPELSFGASSAVFGTQPQSTMSAAKTLTISNTGPMPITVGSVSVTGADAGDFLVDRSNCADALAQGASCALRVSFAPSAPGARTATLTVSDDLWQSVSLSGVGGPLPTGPTGATGPTGPTGPRGPAGKSAHVTCKIASHKPLRVKCTVKLSGRSKSSKHAVRATLARKGQVVGRTTLRNGRLTFRARTALPAGSYLLTLRFSAAGRTVTLRARVRL